MNVFRFPAIAATAFVLALSACNQTDDLTTPSVLEPQFGTSGYDTLSGLTPNSSGLYVVGGTDGDLHRKSLGLYDAYIRKYTRDGRLIWGRQFGTPRNEDANAVAVDSSNNAYVVGGTKTPQNDYGDYDVFLRKYSPSGGVLWARQFGTSVYDGASGIAVSSSGVYVVGFTAGPLTRPVSGGADAFIRKYTLGGAVAWTRQLGGGRYDAATSVAVDAQGYVYVAGNFRGEYDADMFIRKYSPAGNVSWAKAVDYPLHDEVFGGEYYSAELAVSGSNLYIGVDHRYALDDGIEGYQYYKNLRVLKYSTHGTQLWEKLLGERLRVGDEIVSLAADGTGVVFGGPNESFYKLNPSGSEVWVKAIGLSEFDTNSAVGIRPGGEVYVSGSYAKGIRPDGSYDVDAFVRRLDSATGATVWTD